MTVQTSDVSHVALPRPVRLLVAARVVDRLGGFTLAFLPLVLVASYGASLRTAGLLGAGFGLATIPSRLLGGRLADRIGRRATIVLGLGGCAACQLVVAAAPTLAVAGLGVVGLGLCFEIYEPPSQALLADLTPPSQRAAAYSAFGAALAAAGVVAGGLAAALAGVGLRWLFVLDATTCLACALVVRVGLPRIPTTVPAEPGDRAAPWRDRRLLVMVGTGTAFATIYMVMLGGLPLALRRQGLAPWWAGVLLAVGALAVIAGQRWRTRLPGDVERPFDRMRAGYLLLAAGLALAALVAAAHPHGVGYAAAVVVWSLGDVLLLGEPFAVVAGLCGPAGRGSYLAAYGVSWGVATTLAPLLATGLLGLGGAPLLWLVCAGVAAGLGLLQSRVRVAVTGS